MRLIRRSLAAALGGSLAMAIVAAGLYLQVTKEWLYGWDPVYVGFWLVIMGSLFHAAFPKQPLFYRLLGLRVVTSAGEQPIFGVRFARVLTYWIFVFAPESFRYGVIARALPFDGRQTIISQLSIAATLSLLPLFTVTTTAGARGVHDYLFDTVVLTAQSPAIPKGQVRRLGFRLMATRACLLWAFVLTAVALIDWRWRLSETVGSLLTTRAGYLSEVANSLATDPTPIAEMLTAKAPEEHYWNSTFTVFLPGPVERFRFRVPSSTLRSSGRSISAVRRSVLAVWPNLERSTRLVSIDLYYLRAFGPASFEESQEFLVDLRTGKVRFAPTREEFFYGKERLTLAQRLKRSSDPDSAIIYYEPKTAGTVELTSTEWRFPSLDFLAPNPSTSNRFVGGAP